MEITVLKCDRCKQEVEGLIEFSFVNRNAEQEANSESDNNSRNLMGLMFGHKAKEYRNIHGGLCFNCMEELLRWLGHPENSLNSKVKGFSNGTFEIQLGRRIDK